MKYQVVESSKVHKVVTEVNRLMEQGWQPIGGINHVKVGVYTNYLQSMIYRPAPAPPGKA